MSRGLNKVSLIGNVGRDPEIRYTASGAAVANLSIATSESWKDKNSGEQVQKTEWHKVVFFGSLAEIVEKYVHKGSKLYVEGKLQTRKWEKEGVDMYTTEVVGLNMLMLDGRGEGDGATKCAGQDPATKDKSMDDKLANPPAFDDDIPFR